MEETAKKYVVGGVERASTADNVEDKRPAEARTAGEAGNPNPIEQARVVIR